MKNIKQVAEKVVEVVSKGLVCGMGEPKPGQMCVEAAVCYAMGLPHSDNPPCVDSYVRDVKININDQEWSSKKARAEGLKKLAIAQLGSKGKVKGFYKLLNKKLWAQFKVDLANEYSKSAAAEAKHYNAWSSGAYYKMCTFAELHKEESVGLAEVLDYLAQDLPKGKKKDIVLNKICEVVLLTLGELKSPGYSYLYLVEGEGV
jgi:hypothetical protein